MMQRTFVKLGALSLSLLWVAACTSAMDKAKLTKLLEENPDILANAIKKNPSVIGDAIAVAQNADRQAKAAEQAKRMEADREKYFKEPLKPELGATQAFRGTKDAPVTLVAYTDFECPYCSRGSQIVDALLEKYKGKMRFTLKHLPLPFHAKAMISAQYFEAIRKQNPDLALAYHDIVFKSQDKLRTDGEKFLKDVVKQFKGKGLNAEQVAKDLQSPATKAKIESDMAEAKTFGFSGTPSFLVNGVPVRGAVPPEEFAKIVDRFLPGKG